MPKYKVELLRMATDREGADVVVEAAGADEARELALQMYEDDEDGEIEWESYKRVDVTVAEAGAVEELP